MSLGGDGDPYGLHTLQGSVGLCTRGNERYRGYVLRVDSKAK